MSILDDLDEPIRGLAGEAGRPVSFGEKTEREEEVFDMPCGDGKGPTWAGAGTGGMKYLCMGFFGIPGNSCSKSSASPGRSGGSRRRKRQRSIGSDIGQGPGNPITSDSGSVPESQLETLKTQAGHLEKALDGIKRRIQELKSGAKRDQQV